MIEFYPQMLDRCYTDFHLFQICLASVDYLFHTDSHGGTRRGINENENNRSLEGVLCPQADGFGNANYVNARELT